MKPFHYHKWLPVDDPGIHYMWHSTHSSLVRLNIPLAISGQGVYEPVPNIRRVDSASAGLAVSSHSLRVRARETRNRSNSGL
jgi:hypothetical protein